MQRMTLIMVPVCVLVALGSSGAVVASGVHYEKPDKYVKRADALVVVRFLRAERKQTGRCTLSVTLTYQYLRPIKGRLPKNQQLTFTVSHYVWKQGCPSVQYSLPPSGGAKDESLATVNRFGTSYVITSTYAMSELPRLRKLLR